MTRSLRNALLTLAIGFAIACGSIASASVPMIERDEPGARVPPDWRGGPVSLPIGRQHLPTEILAASFELPQAQDLQSLFYSRGYVRRLDLDCAGGTDSLSFVLLGWEKPGSAVTDEAPAIQIISKSYFDVDLGRHVIATQTFGGVVRDSADSLTTYETGPDAPVAVVELVPADMPGAIVPDPGKLPQAQDSTTPYRYAYHEGPGGVGRTIKDGWTASCPFRRGLARASLAFTTGAIGASTVISGNWWAAGALAAVAVSADTWVNGKMPCR